VFGHGSGIIVYYGPAVGTGTATVTEAPIIDSTPQATSDPMAATEGVDLSGVTFAPFTYGDPSATTDHFVATVGWGGGTTSAGTRVPSDDPDAPDDTFVVHGEHPYRATDTPVVGVTDAGRSHPPQTAGLASLDPPYESRP
jgi:hypothetical protein